MKYVNLTPHPVKVVVDDQSEVTIPPSGKVLRMVEEDTPIAQVGEIKVVKRNFTLPQQALEEIFTEEDAVYIVSLPLLMMLKASEEGKKILSTFTVVAPDTGKGAVRDSAGNIVGTRGFITI